MDPLSLVGIVLGFGAILIGQQLEGGSLSSIINPVALLIVLGGTLGAVMLQTPLNTFLRALKLSAWVLKPPTMALDATLEKILEWNRVARNQGLLKLELLAQEEKDLFSQKGLQLIADGADANFIRDVLENDLDQDEMRDLQAAKVFDAMGGFSPTIGIIGAVLGLIQVMGNLDDPSMLGSGIAVAFVATIYGVGFANLLFLPIGSKLKLLVNRRSNHQMMLIEGLISVARGENPRITESRLQAYLG